jgi:FMN phosphatase YigB (HAD superfamily)
MKKIVFRTITLATLVSLSFFTSDLHTTGGKSIILDLEGVLVEPDPTAAVKEMGCGGLLAMGSGLGFSGVLSSAFRRSTPTEQLVGQFFKAIELIPYVGIEQEEQKRLNTIKLPYKGHQAPPLIKQWLVGSTVGSTIIEQYALESLAKGNLSKSEKTLATKFTSMTFNPDKNAETVKVIKEALNLIKELKLHNNNLYIIAHWNHEAIEKMKRYYPELFDLIGDSIMTSAEAQKIKPELYSHSIDTFNLDLENCFFIESDKAHLDYALKLGSCDKRPQGIVCTQNYDEIRAALQKFDALPKG